MQLAQRLAEYISACFTGLWIESHEHDDALREIAQLCREQNWRLATWDIEQGLRIPGQNNTADAGGSDPLAAIRSINALASADSSAILVLTNFHRFLSISRNRPGPGPTDHPRQGEPHLPGGPVARSLRPRRTEKLFVVIEHDFPAASSLKSIARGVATEDGELPEGDKLGTRPGRGRAADPLRGRGGVCSEPREARPACRRFHLGFEESDAKEERPLAALSGHGAIRQLGWPPGDEGVQPPFHAPPGPRQSAQAAQGRDAPFAARLRKIAVRKMSAYRQA